MRPNFFSHTSLEMWKAIWRFSLFRIPRFNRDRFYDGSFRLNISIEMRKVLWWFSAFRFLVVWFLLSFVFLLLFWRIGGYAIFSGLRSVFFRRVGCCAVFGLFLRCFCGRFCGVKIELWWSLWWFLRFRSGVGEGCALWRVRKWSVGFGLFDIPKCRFVDHLDAKQRCSFGMPCCYVE